ncbi:hypothetical protein AVEN_190970-1 [Araneus ventricosus]|uniref:Uncharacterized protein n=1 Tax=Araneus ventricosus TaxID=182803 RepID=A0A4Y2N8G5_ARAVE|nr:hypothetical protein AVEN_190970-1 [Araneus ventricosus]
MKWVILLCVVAVTAVCLARGQPLPNETIDEFEGVDMRRITGRLGEVMRRLYEKSDRYELASHLLRAVFEHLFVVFYRGE